MKKKKDKIIFALMGISIAYAIYLLIPDSIFIQKILKLKCSIGDSYWVEASMLTIIYLPIFMSLIYSLHRVKRIFNYEYQSKMEFWYFFFFAVFLTYVIVIYFM